MFIDLTSIYGNLQEAYRVEDIDYFREVKSRDIKFSQEDMESRKVSFDNRYEYAEDFPEIITEIVFKEDRGPIGYTFVKNSVKDIMEKINKQNNIN